VSPRAAAAAAAAAAALLLAGIAGGREPRPIRVGYHEEAFLVARAGGAHRLTRGPEYHVDPVWSHDSRRIAVGADHAIEILSLAGTVKHRIPHTALALAWAPDDERIAYVHGHGLVVSGLDGHARTIVPAGVSAAVDWSPDGRTIYYRHDRLRHDSSIWAVRSDGGKPRLLVSGVYSGSRVLVSPDGDHVLFERYGLWVARTAGGGEREVIDSNGLYAGYGWLADGRVFGGLRSNDNRPVVATVSGKRRRLGVEMRTRRYDLSPDGKRIAWASVRYRHHSVLVISARPDGSDYRVLARFTSKLFPEIDDLVWSPDGSRLAVVPHRHFGD
jgi:hypothetical protein